MMKMIRNEHGMEWGVIDGTMAVWGVADGAVVDGAVVVMDVVVEDVAVRDDCCLLDGAEATSKWTRFRLAIVPEVETFNAAAAWK